MFVIDNETLLRRDAVLRQLEGKAAVTLVDVIAASKVIDFAAARARRQPAPHPRVNKTDGAA
ncbi:hypothetical protein [Bradyrhizobium genosp. P]|uniref:hypothetical protein n=1 Tax=Bradyrhizobium genosp. P TaxID=83641 RepID=UPI003CFA0584